MPAKKTLRKEAAQPKKATGEQSAPESNRRPLEEFVRACGAATEALNKGIQEISHARGMLRLHRVTMSEDTEATWWLAAMAADDALRQVSLAFHRTLDENHHEPKAAMNTVKSLPEKAEVGDAG